MVRLGIADSKLRCWNEIDGTGWAIRVEDILLIAEYTTEDGPDADDYFLVFVTREDKHVFYSAATMAAEGLNATLERLEAVIGAPLELILASSPGGLSRVVWPAELAGSAYFEYDEIEPESLREKIRARFKGKRRSQRVADGVLGYISERAQTGEGVA